MTDDPIREHLKAAFDIAQAAAQAGHDPIQEALARAVPELDDPTATEPQKLIRALRRVELEVQGVPGLVLGAWPHPYPRNILRTITTETGVSRVDWYIKWIAGASQFRIEGEKNHGPSDQRQIEFHMDTAADVLQFVIAVIAEHRSKPYWAPLSAVLADDDL